MYQTVFLRISTGIMVFCLAACATEEKPSRLPYYNTPDFTPIFAGSGNKAPAAIDHTIGEFSFTNQHGQMVTDQTVEGKIHVANFIFTICGSICPTMTKHMKLVDKAFESDSNVVILSYSVTPWIDSVQRLKAYAEHNGINSARWHFLTGSRTSIYTLARQSYFAEEDLGFTKDSSEFLHTEHVLLVDKTKRIRGIYNGTLQLETEQMIRDIRQLAQE